MRACVPLYIFFCSLRSKYIKPSLDIPFHALLIRILLLLLWQFSIVYYVIFVCNMYNNKIWNRYSSRVIYKILLSVFTTLSFGTRFKLSFIFYFKTWPSATVNYYRGLFNAYNTIQYSDYGSVSNVLARKNITCVCVCVCVCAQGRNEKNIRVRAWEKEWERQLFWWL